MNTADVDIDRLVDYRSEYTQYIKKAKITGDQLIGLCPFHDDKNNSFSVNLKTGQWHCFAEDRGGNFTQFYAEVNGLDTKEAYSRFWKNTEWSRKRKRKNQSRRRATLWHNTHSKSACRRSG